jgi:hypothetical protein
MKTALALFFSLVTLVFAEDNTAIQIKRVASVTWDPKAAKLIWVIQNGVEEKGEFVPSSEERYEISPTDGVMAFQGEKRGITDPEAARLLNLLHVLTGYCVQSTVWWYQGESVPSDDGKPTGPPPGDRSNPKPETGTDTTLKKVIEPHNKKAPGMLQPVVRDILSAGSPASSAGR